jgi:hypothetical protein
MDFGLGKQLLEDVFDHALGDVQGRCDIRVGLALSHSAKYLQLAVM